MRLISAQNGYDFRDLTDDRYRRVPLKARDAIARRVRKQERASLARELAEADDTFDDLDAAKGYEEWCWTPFYQEQPCY